MSTTRHCRLFKATKATPTPALMRELHWHRSCAEVLGYATINLPEDNGQMKVIFGDLKTITKNVNYTVYSIVAPSFLYNFSLKYNDIVPTFLHLL